jgi:hypothetical protein
MRGAWGLGLVVAAGLILGGPGRGLAQKDGTRDVFLQTIGLLAGQGLVVGHESLEGLAARFEKRQMPKDKALEALSAARRYAELVLSAFSNRLMGQLTDEEKKDLKLLIGFYETQRGAIVALTDYVRLGGAKNREAFEEMQGRVAAIIRQITLPAGTKPAS